MALDLHSACLVGDLDRVKELIGEGNREEMKTVITEREEGGENGRWTVIERREMSPLECALVKTHLPLVKYFLEECGEVDQSILRRSFHFVCHEGERSLISYFLDLFSIPLDISLVPTVVSPSSSSSSLCLWYEKAAGEWLEGLPLGNGRLGGMIFGGYPRETIQLNIDTLWAGCPHDYSHRGAVSSLPQIRQLIEEEKWVDAQTMLDEKFFGEPVCQVPYQTVGNVLIDFFDPSLTKKKTKQMTNYHRELNLLHALNSTCYSSSDGEITYQRRCFTSYPDQLLVYEIESSKSNRIDCVVSFVSPQRFEMSIVGGNRLVIDGRGGDWQGMNGEIRFRLLIDVQCDGQLFPLDNHKLIISSSTNVLLRLVLATNYLNYSSLSVNEVELAEQILRKSLLFTYSELFSRHVVDYHRLFNRVQLNLGESPSMSLPTDRRVQMFSSNPQRDPQLLTLYFQFGRYLLISCSRLGSQAATLQGIWNDSLQPPWQSKYTININIEMNYWPAGPANLLDCYSPLFQLIEDIHQTGQNTAQQHYGTKRDGSWVCHHNTDIWRGTAPVDASVSGTWPTGGIWLCKSIWDSFLFTQDRPTLLRSYPIVRHACQFFLETLVSTPSGSLLTSPSMSPEVAHHPSLNGVVCQGPTLDILLIRDLFHSLIESSRLFQIDELFREEVQRALERLPPLQIGQLGQIQEWNKDWDNNDDRHNRHLSHLYCVYPGNSVTIDSGDLHDAALRSLSLRGVLIPSPGWSLAWKANLWARLHQGSTSFELLTMLLTPLHTSSNLFDLISGPPFQIDGNFGGTSAICEMLLQSQRDRIELLPALPSSQWKEGFVQGLRARGNFQVNIWWQQSKLHRAEIIPLNEHSLSNIRITYQDKDILIEHLIPKHIYHLDGQLTLTHLSIQDIH